MSRISGTILILTCLIVVGCVALPPTPLPAPSPSPKSGTIRFFDLSNVDVRDVPMLMAQDALRAQGYTVEATLLASSSLIADGLARGDADIGLLNNQTMWAAIDKGADVRTIAQSVGSTSTFAVKEGIESCQELDGRPVGFASTTGVSPALLDQYFKENCPDAKPQFLVIPESAGRVAALLAGELDAASLPGEELLKLQQNAPGRFRALAVMSKVFPQIQVEGLHARREWAQENPQIVRDFLRALLEANRQIVANPQLLYDEAQTRLGLDAATVKAVADSHLQAGIWDANGGLTQEKIQDTIDFLTGIDELPAGLTVEKVADLSYLNAVLDEIGRR